MRKAFALIATTGLVLAVLTGCSSGSGAADCNSPVTDGAASKLVKVSGAFDKSPKVDFPTPLKTKTTERSQIIAGTGDGLVAGQKVKLDLSFYNGTTGKVIEKSKYDGTSPTPIVLNDKTIKGLSEGLKCAQVGSRVTLVVPPKDAFGPEGGNKQLGVGKDDTLVFVVDVTKAYLPRANGSDQPVAAGLPSVVLAKNGAPGITIPSAKPPTKLEVGVLKKGSGATVKKGDQITVHYTGVLWDTKKVFDSSWTSGQPAELVAAPGSATQPGVIPGFANAVIGQAVGSQVIAVIPPSEGYGDKGSGPVPAGATLVFVVDILGVN